MYFSLLPSSLVEAQSKVENSFATNESLFVVVLDVDIEDVDGAVELATLVVQIFQHSIEAAFFAGDDNIHNTGLGTLRALVFGVFQPWLARHPVLEALGKSLDVEIATQHVQQTIVRVQCGILLCQLVMDGAVGSAVEVVHIGLCDGWTW